MTTLYTPGIRLSETLARGSRKLWDPFGDDAPTPATTLAKQPAIAQPSIAHGEMLSLTFAVCTVFFLVKVLIALRDLNSPDLPPFLAEGGLLPTLGRVWACCAEDFAVGLGCLLVAALALALSAAGWYRCVVRLLAHLAAAAALAYMAGNAHLFHIMRRFLTVTLFQLGGGFQPERSVQNFLTSSFWLALILAPMLTLAVHLAWSAAFSRFWRRSASFVCRPLVLFLLILSLAGAAQAARKMWFATGNADFAENPHLLLIRSFFSPMPFGDLEGEEVAVDDFQPGDPRPSVGLINERPKNIVLIVLESAGAKYFSTYGYSIETTPQLAKLSDKGIVYDNFYATANHTIASGMPLFGSTYNELNTISTVVKHPEFPVPDAQSWLKGEGYQTCFLGSGGQMAWEKYRNISSAFVDQGFDVGRDPGALFWQAHADPTAFLKRSYMDAEMFADGKRFVRESKGKKFYLMMWNYDTHSPYFNGGDDLPLDDAVFPSALNGDAERTDEFRAFLRSIHRVDALIGDFYRDLEEQGLADDTVVMITGDHGEAWGQHGIFFHGESLYDEEVRVPLFVLCPRLAHLGPRDGTLGSHIDVWPTLMDICGLPANPLWQGRSLLGKLPAKERRAYFFHRGELGVREGKYKYIWDYQAQRDLLFDLEKDPGETDNLAGEDAAFCKRQRARLRDWRDYQEELTKERLKQAGR
jgi:glucan phosphoethanolaminetransferase (alkaline phosphatase superfamily)